MIVPLKTLATLFFNKIKCCLKAGLSYLCLRLIRFVQRFPGLKSFILSYLKKHSVFYTFLCQLIHKPNASNGWKNEKNCKKPLSHKVLSASARHIYAHLKTGIEANIRTQQCSREKR
jgi:hypothetical protein